KAVSRGDVAALADQSPSQAIGSLQKLCHDLMAVGSGAAPRFFDAADLPPAVPSHLALARWSKSLTNAARTAEHPFNAGLMLEALVSEARTTLNSAARRP
ncbi:MAG TPA: DNA polymerase III subunit delta', partial [Variovorax sp.]|nr:DNA polymerase III subunit delta' [Variovorax sp.]